MGVDCALSPALAKVASLPDRGTLPEHLSRALSRAAYSRSLDPKAKTPFAEYSRRHGYRCVGGKPDDITVVCAWVVPEKEDLERLAGGKGAGGRGLPDPNESPVSTAAGSETEME